MLSIFCLWTVFAPFPNDWLHHLMRHLNLSGRSVIIAPEVPACVLLLAVFTVVTVFHGLNMVLFDGCFLLVLFCYWAVAIVDAFVICHIAVDASSVICLSLLQLIGFVSACAVFGVCFARGVLLLVL